MAWLSDIVGFIFPDGLIYGLIVIVFLVGIFKCCRPVLRNARALKRGTDLIRDGAKAKLARPVWNETGFLGKRLQTVWHAYLKSAEVGAASGVSSDVAEYIHDDSIITDPGKASLADIIPNLCTSLGILGTFIGLSMGLTGLDVMEVSSYTQLTGGIALAFNTSIVGMVGAILFNLLYRYSVGRAREATDTFVDTFYTYAIAQPPDAQTQLLAYEREQADSLSQFAQDISVRMAGEIHRAVSSAMEPVQASMEDFMNAATRAQVDGLDYIVARFIDRMNRALDGEMGKLREALIQTSEGQLRAQENLRNAVDSINQITQSVVEVHGVSEQIITKFSSYVGDMGSAYRQVSENQADATDMLEEISEASLRQAKYLAALQEYQSKLQESFQDYSVWTDKFVTGMEQRTAEQNAALSHVTDEMRASSELLRGAYKSFTEAIELGLANALGLFNENMQNLVRQMDGTLGDIHATMASMEETIKRVSKELPSGQEVK